MVKHDYSRCQGAFQDLPQISVTYLVSFVLYWIALSAIIVVWLMTILRKTRTQNKALIGAFFAISLFANLISYTIRIAGLVLQECGEDYNSHYKINIAADIFSRLALFCLLVVVTLNLNTAIFGNLDTKRNVSKLVTIIVLTFMGLLTIAFTGLTCYVWWFGSHLLYNVDVNPVLAEIRLAVAYWVLYLFTLFVGAGFMISGFMATKSRRVFPNRTVSLIASVYLAMIAWVSISLANSAKSLQYETFELDTYAALQVLYCFFQALVYIFVLLMGRSKDSGVIHEK